VNRLRRAARRLVIPIGISVGVLSASVFAYATAGRPDRSGPEGQAPPTGARSSFSSSGPAAVMTAPALKGTPTAAPTASPKPAASPYLGRVGSSVAAATTATTTVALSSTPAGSLLVASVALVGTASGIPQVADSAGDVFRLDVNQTDASGDTLLIYTAASIRTLTGADSVTVTFPAAAAHAVAVDAFAGHTVVDQTTSATGTGGTADTGRTGATAAPGELAVAGLVGAAGPATVTGFAALPPLTAGGATLAIGYRVLGAAGKYSAGGTAAGDWLAGLVTIR
jgi:hypothetical protein